MEDLLRSYLKGFLDDYIQGLDESYAFSNGGVTLRDLKLRTEKLQKCMPRHSAFELTGATIGSLQMKVAWPGNVQLVLSDVSFDLNFNPSEFMKKKFGDRLTPRKGAAVPEGYVYRLPHDLQQPSNWLPMMTGAPLARVEKTPAFCTKHRRAKDRKKGRPWVTSCGSCGVWLHTNYAECSLCGPCSKLESKCMACGEDSIRELQADAQLDADLLLRASEHTSSEAAPLNIYQSGGATSSPPSRQERCPTCGAESRANNGQFERQEAAWNDLFNQEEALFGTSNASCPLPLPPINVDPDMSDDGITQV
jgi:hypothetical protein